MEPRAPVASPRTTASDAQSAFDPFIFGLVPTFKREGAEGIRREEVKIDNRRKAVLAAVEQSDSDRKAQLQRNRNYYLTNQ